MCPEITKSKGSKFYIIHYTSVYDLYPSLTVTRNLDFLSDEILS